MGEPVFEIEPLKKRVLELLRRHDSYMPTGAVALALEVPLWAADAALEAAYLAKEAEFAAGAGWRAIAVQNLSLPREDVGQGAMDLGA